MEEIKSLDDADYGYDQDSYTHNDEWCLQSEYCRDYPEWKHSYDFS